MKKGLRKVLRISGIAAGVLVLLLVAAFLVVLFDKPLVRRVSQKFLSGKTGVALEIGKLDYTLFPLHVVASSVKASYKAPMFTVIVTVDRLEARGNLKKLLAGTRPAFESIDVDIAELRFDQTKISETPTDFATIIPQVGDFLAYAKRISFNCRVMSLTLPGQRFELEALALAFSRTAAASARAFDLRLDTGAARAAIEPGGLAVNTRLHASGTLTLASAAAVDLRLSLDALEASAAGKPVRLPGLSLTTAGTWDTKAAAISLSKLDLDVPGLATASGTIAAVFGKDPSLEAAGAARFQDLASLTSLAAPFLPPAFQGTLISGETSVQGKAARPPRSSGKPASVEASLDLRKVAISYPQPSGAISAEINGSVKLSGPLADPEAVLDLDVASGRFARAPLAIGGSAVHLTARASRRAAEISRLDGSLRAVSAAPAGGNMVSLETVTFNAAGRVDLAAKSAALSHLESSLHKISVSLVGGNKASLETATFKAAGRVDLAAKSAALSRLEGSLHKFSAGLPSGKTFALDDIKVAGAASLDLTGRAAVIPGIEVRLANFAPIKLSGRYDPAPGGTKTARIESKGLNFASLRALLAPFLPPSLAGWDMDASADIVLDASGVPGRRASSASAPAALRPSSSASSSVSPDSWTFSGSLSFASAKFNDPSFTIAGEGLKPRLDIRGAYDGVASALDLSATLAVAEGESLWKSFYVSWAKFPLKADLGGRVLLASRAIENLSAKFDLPGLGEVHATGTASLSPTVSARLRAGGRLGLTPLYSLNSQAGSSAGTRLRLAGEIGADLALVKDKDGLAVDGRLTIDDASMENPASKSSLTGISAAVPVHLLLASGPVGAGTPAGQTVAIAPPANQAPTGSPAVPIQQPAGTGSPEDRGTLKIGKIATPSLTLDPPTLTIVSRPNAFRLEPFSLDLFGSRFEFGAISLELDPLAKTFRGAASLRPVEIDLARLPLASPSLPLTGKARLDFPALDITPARIGVTGRVDVDIFGGHVAVRDIAVVEPLAAGRAITCNIDLLDLDLKKVTDVIPFGEMTGIVRGEVRGLSITYGQPESFALRLESVPRKGVAQTFSLKAVNNLTVISSGQQATAGTGGFWMRFIRGFRYAKLGIVSTLRNDTFTLNGTIHDRGVEYLVKKPPLFGINVINRMPDKKISFREMMGRLESIGSGSEKPVVKSKIR